MLSPFVSTCWHHTILAIQCDNGGEFLNTRLDTFCAAHGVLLRFSCPHTSQQNGKAERAIRTTNDVIRTLIFQAYLPPSFWAEALYTATYLINICPTSAINFSTPYTKLFGLPPSYNDLRVFGCLCYPNISSTAPHKLAPRSTKCIFLGYPPRIEAIAALISPPIAS
jgi:histone deacetylase 1/2